MRKTWLLCAFVFVGCAAPYVGWTNYPEPLNPQRAAQVRYQCTREVNEMTKGAWAMGSMLFIAIHQQQQKERATNLMIQCMAAHGYRPITAEEAGNVKQFREIHEMTKE